MPVGRSPVGRLCPVHTSDYMPIICLLYACKTFYMGNSFVRTRNLFLVCPYSSCVEFYFRLQKKPLHFKELSQHSLSQTFYLVVVVVPLLALC